MPNPYNNKIQLADGTVLLDLSSDTLSSADQLAQGIVAHDRTGAVITGTGGTPAVVVTEEPDTGGGIVKNITALDISDTTAVASDVAQGKYFYTSSGVKTAGTASGGGGGLEYEEGTVTLASQGNTMTVTFSNSHSVAPIFFMISENSGAKPSAGTGTNVYSYVYANWDDCFGNPIYATDSDATSGLAYESYKALNGTNFTRRYLTAENLPSTEITASGVSLNRSAERMSWLANVPYKWIAVWAPTT